MGLLDDAIREHLELKRRRGADAGSISREESEALGPVRRGPDGAPELADTFTPGDPAPGAAAGDTAWDSDETSVLGTTPGAHEPPAAAPPYEPPPAPPPAAPTSGYAPPPVPSHEPTVSAPAYEPPPPPAYEPPAPPPPASPPAPDRPWFERAHHGYEPAAVEPDPYAESEPEPEHQSLLSRFRVGRRSKQTPPPAGFDEPSSSYDPPPLPACYEPASAYEPPPPPAPSHSFDPPTVQHEPDIVPADEEPDVEDVLEETPDFLEETPEHDRLWFEQRPPRDFDFDD
jgi:hypothetical protein